MRPSLLLAVSPLAALLACDTGGGPAPFTTRTVAGDPQRPGDPEAGYRALVNGAYITCGVPYSAYAKAAGPTPPEALLPGREGRNAGLPYALTAVQSPAGVELVSNNCLSCHAGRINGQLVVGLGNASSDFTGDAAGYAQLAGGLITDPREKAEWRRWADRIIAIAPYTTALTMGTNPADNLTAALLSHKDRRTLAWSDEPLLEPPPTAVVPVDVPPWWRMGKRSSMFYNASGRGDHARIMMTASLLCTDSVAEAAAIDAMFPDVRAYIASLRPPAYPFPVDAAQAARGKEVFGRTCAGCHGTYGEGGSYPNLLVSVDVVGTDDTLAAGASQFAGRFVDWYNESFFGERARIDPQPGYVAPPLDGIWATAPYLHNGSVPTLRALLDSPRRPRSFLRSFDSRDYDPQAVGWRYAEVPHGQDDEPQAERRKRIYDTTKPGYGNGGHTFGDALSPEDRAAVIEYLKTL